jgi:hypothetical protein
MCRNIHFVVPEKGLRIFPSGTDALAEYRFNTGTARHLFCSRCGISPFYRPRSNPAIQSRAARAGGSDGLAFFMGGGDLGHTLIWCDYRTEWFIHRAISEFTSSLCAGLYLQWGQMFRQGLALLASAPTTHTQTPALGPPPLEMMMKPRQPLHLALSALITLAAGAVQAQDIKFANIVEMSGPGTTSGVMFKNGVELAIKEINAAGGIMGRKISYTSEDTQSNPGVAKGLTQKAVDNDVFAIFGPVYSGSIMVSMAESKRGETPNFTGGEASSITQQGNPWVFRTAFGQSVSFPKVARYINGKSKKLAVLYVNNDFGKGGQAAIKQLLANSPTQIVAEISTESGQVDFSNCTCRRNDSCSTGIRSGPWRRPVSRIRAM